MFNDLNNQPDWFNTSILLFVVFIQICFSFWYYVIGEDVWSPSDLTVGIIRGDHYEELDLHEMSSDGWVKAKAFIGNRPAGYKVRIILHQLFLYGLILLVICSSLVHILSKAAVLSYLLRLDKMSPDRLIVGNLQCMCSSWVATFRRKVKYLIKASVISAPSAAGAFISTVTYRPRWDHAGWCWLWELCRGKRPARFWPTLVWFWWREYLFVVPRLHRQHTLEEWRKKIRWLFPVSFDSIINNLDQPLLQNFFNFWQNYLALSCLVVCFQYYLTTSAGFYMHIEASEWLDSSSTARLMSFPRPVGRIMCVSFWYRIFGNSIGMCLQFGTFWNPEELLFQMLMCGLVCRIIKVSNEVSRWRWDSCVVKKWNPRK